MGVPPPGWNKFPTFPKSKIGGLPFDRILDRILRSRLKNDKVSSLENGEAPQPKMIEVTRPEVLKREEETETRSQLFKQRWKCRFAISQFQIGSFILQPLRRRISLQPIIELLSYSICRRAFLHLSAK